MSWKEICDDCLRRGLRLPPKHVIFVEAEPSKTYRLFAPPWNKKDLNTESKMPLPAKPVPLSKQKEMHFK